MECRSCILRCIKAVVGNAPVAATLQPNALILTPRLAWRTTKRSLATAPGVVPHEKGATQSRAPSSNDALTMTEPTETDTSVARSERRALQLELEYLKDPKKLADHIHYVLSCEKPEKALELCRLASKKQSCVVAWNHTIDWHMQRGKVNEAIKIYNEMKKRAQFPDTYTYMIMFRGFPQHRTHHGAELKAEFVSKAVSIYNSMQSPTSRVKPNISHTNAVLRVCSLARDMDALWGIAGQLPADGPGSPDHITYTILLDAIRFSAFGSEDHASLFQMTELRQKAANEGRRIWRDVIERWRGGEVIIDHELVCSMANLLLVSRRMEDWDDVLNLIQQTTTLKRLIAPLGSSGRKQDHVPRDDAEDVPDESVEDAEGWVPTPAAAAFKETSPLPCDGAHPHRPTSLAYLEPDDGLLSAAIDACKKMRIPKTAYSYWDAIVDKAGVKPSVESYRLLLSIMSINRNSGRAARLLQDLHSAGSEMRNMLFRQAMSTCMRDNKNPNVVENATKVIDVMMSALPHPDIQTLHFYLRVAHSTNEPRDVVAALDVIAPTVDLLNHSTASSGVIKFGSNMDGFVTQADALELFQSMISTIDNLIRDQSISGPEVVRLQNRRTQLDRLVGRLSNSVQDRRERDDRRRRAVNDYREAKRALETRKAELESQNLALPTSGRSLRMSNAEWQAMLNRNRRARKGSLFASTSQRTDRRFERLSHVRKEQDSLGKAVTSFQTHSWDVRH